MADDASRLDRIDATLERIDEHLNYLTERHKLSETVEIIAGMHRENLERTNRLARRLESR